ncbi:MAG: YeeE/YedE thiosulfate transporter family protein [Caldilineaceae bacterium]
MDDWVVPMVFGTLAGGLVSGWLNGRLKGRTNKGPNISNRRRWVWAFVGGVIMGYGARWRALHLVRRCRVGPRSPSFVGLYVCRLWRGLMRWPTLCGGCGIDENGDFVTSEEERRGIPHLGHI